ncbi:MAG: putative zinc-binding metallopeptidase [Acidobacteria bacterium]|nr:putative zinc-binding metallopeptidase [Acidobacteriota bacterium]
MPWGFVSVALANDLNRMTDEQLLEIRICDLPLSIEGTPLEQRVAWLYEEIDARGLRFNPHVWLSEEWFSPDEVPGFAIPFYLAHPRLAKLERSQMLEVEGGTEKDCLRIMRHETGHAIDNAFHIHGRRRYRELFGSFKRPYPDSYKPEPNSRDYVLHLPAWYAQAHPAEDFAETFAVWLAAPAARWRRQYTGWPALNKLKYVDEVMSELAGKPPANKSRVRAEDLPEIETTLREHYRNKKKHYAFQWPPNYDRDLLRIFSSEPRHASCPSAVSFLRRSRRELCHEVAEGTGAHNYAIAQKLSHMANRCRELNLRMSLTPGHTRQKVLVLLTVQTMNGIYSGYHRIAL